jgi:hypothetical protein
MNRTSKMSILLIMIINLFFVNCQSQPSVREEKEGVKWSVLELLLYLQKSIPTLTYEILPKWDNNNRSVPFDAIFKLYENGRPLYIISRESNAEAIELANRETNNQYNNQYNILKEYIYVWGRFCFFNAPETGNRGSPELNIIDEQLNKEIYGIDRNPFLGEWKLRIPYNADIKFIFREEIYSMEGFGNINQNTSNYIERPYWYTRDYIFMWFGNQGPYLIKYNFFDNNKLLTLELAREELRFDRIK